MSILSPFPPSSSVPGKGLITARLLASGVTCLETVAYQYPLKLIASASARPNAVAALVFLLSYGGGLVGGDVIDLSVTVLPSARLSLVTQGNTKIFRPAADPGQPVTRQRLQVQLHRSAALCHLPDPVQPFADSRYVQEQVFRVTRDSSLCVLDWVTHGRGSRGEDWSFVSWTGRNQLWLVADDGGGGPDRLLVRDAVILDRDDGRVAPNSLRETMRGLVIIGTLLLRGPLVDSVGNFFLSEFAALPRVGARGFGAAESSKLLDGESDLRPWRAARLDLEALHSVLWSAAQVRGGCVIVKFGAGTVDGGRAWLSSMLVRQGGIAEVFGSEALMSVA